MAGPPRFAQLELVCGTPPLFMDWALFTRVLARLPLLERLHLEGSGEPMLHPLFFDAVAHAAGRGISVSAATTLEALGPGGERRLLECGLDVLEVAVDGATRETYEALRAPARFLRVLRHLSAIRRAKERAGAVRPRLAVKATAVHENLHELSALVRLSRRLGIARVFVDEFAPDGIGLRHESGRVERCFSRARQAARECGVDLRLPGDVAAGAVLGRPWEALHFRWDGSESPCGAAHPGCALYRAAL